MSGQPIEITSRGEADTLAFGRQLAGLLPDSATVGLTGPLGAGKTVVVRGMAEALGIDPRQVMSPSFVYMVEYEEGLRPLVHADLYRLAELPEAEAERVYSGIGLHAALSGPGLATVEWWEHYRGPRPESLVIVELDIENPEDRTIKLELSGRGLERLRAHWSPPVGDEQA